MFDKHFNDKIIMKRINEDVGTENEKIKNSVFALESLHFKDT